MKGKLPMRRVAYLAALAALAFGLAGCESFQKAAGLTKSPPDEFAVVTKAPLIIPPDYNLKPPSPGAAPTNQVGPTDAAEGALFGNGTMVSGAGRFSTGERELLAKAGATDASNMIRQKIAADNRAMQAANNSFTDQILFGLGTSSPQKPPQASDDSSSSQKDSGGWLDGIF